MGDPIAQSDGGRDCFSFFLLPFLREGSGPGFFCLGNWANFWADSSLAAVAFKTTPTCHVMLA